VALAVAVAVTMVVVMAVVNIQEEENVYCRNMVTAYVNEG
jgi:hypothetical protein